MEGEEVNTAVERLSVAAAWATSEQRTLVAFACTEGVRAIESLQAALAAEREACAKIAGEMMSEHDNLICNDDDLILTYHEQEIYDLACERIASAIRAREKE